MEFTCSVTVNLPLEKAVALYDNPANMAKWQDGFVRKEPISGEPGKAGSKAKITFNNRGRKMELIETIQSNNLPADITALYEHVHMSNTLTTKFSAVSPNQTLVEMGAGYIKLN